MVLLSSVQTASEQQAARLDTGADGYLARPIANHELVARRHSLVREVIAGRHHLPPAVADKVLTADFENRGSGNLDALDTLTKRERLVLLLAAEGNTSAEIAPKLFISPRPAETHRANLMRKLNLRSQTDLVRFIIRHGIISA